MAGDWTYTPLDAGGTERTLGSRKKKPMSTLLLVILILLLIGAFPAWPYSRSWGYYPTGGIGAILLLVVVLLLLGVI